MLYILPTKTSQGSLYKPLPHVNNFLEPCIMSHLPLLRCQFLKISGVYEVAKHKLKFRLTLEAEYFFHYLFSSPIKNSTPN